MSAIYLFVFCNTSCYNLAHIKIAYLSTTGRNLLQVQSFKYWYLSHTLTEIIMESPLLKTLILQFRAVYLLKCSSLWNQHQH